MERIPLVICDKFRNFGQSIAASRGHMRQKMRQLRTICCAFCIATLCPYSQIERYDVCVVTVLISLDGISENELNNRH